MLRTNLSSKLYPNISSFPFADVMHRCLIWVVVILCGAFDAHNTGNCNDCIAAKPGDGWLDRWWDGRLVGGPEGVPEGVPFEVGGPEDAG